MISAEPNTGAGAKSAADKVWVGKARTKRFAPCGFTQSDGGTHFRLGASGTAILYRHIDVPTDKTSMSRTYTVDLPDRSTKLGGGNTTNLPATRMHEGDWTATQPGLVEHGSYCKVIRFSQCTLTLRPMQSP